MFVRVFLSCFACFAEEAVSSDSVFSGDRVRFSGVSEVQWAVDLDGGNSQKLESQLQPRLELELPRNVEFTTILRFRADLFDNLEPGAPSQPEIAPQSRRVLFGDRVDAEIREFYMETTWRAAYLTIGKQQTVWGKADGLKVLDVVNPQDYREFVLDDWEDSRIPLWTLKAEVPVKDMTLQLLWITDTTCHRLPQEGSPFLVTAGQPDLPDRFHIEMHGANRPARFLTDSDLGLRLTAFRKGWDLSFNYLYHYADAPVLHRRIGLSEDGPTIHVYPEYVRSHLIGATFSNAFGNLTLRGEMALNLGSMFATTWNVGDGPARKMNEFAYVLGFDWYGIKETFLSLQCFQNWALGDTKGLVRNKVESYVSFLARRELLHDTLFLKALLIENLDGRGGMLRLEASYELREDMRIWAGLDLFHGSATENFGQFDSRDRLIAGIKWFF